MLVLLQIGNLYLQLSSLCFSSCLGSSHVVACAPAAPGSLTVFLIPGRKRTFPLIPATVRVCCSLVWVGPCAYLCINHCSHECETLGVPGSSARFWIKISIIPNHTGGSERAVMKKRGRILECTQDRFSILWPKVPSPALWQPGVFPWTHCSPVGSTDVHLFPKYLQ